MCGFSGFIAKKHEPEKLGRMLQCIAHRGPDGEGKFIGTSGEWIAHLGHRRLAIIDIAGGVQPFFSEDKKYSLIFNGEIFNFRDLAKKLELKGVKLSTKSDTEVLLLWLIHFPNRLDELNGMFAFAFWNSVEGSLLLARDRAGIKPLYFSHRSSGEIAFASELNCFFELDWNLNTLERNGVVSYFFSDFAQAPLTMIEGVNKLQAGQFLKWQQGMIVSKDFFWQSQVGAVVHDPATTNLESILDKSIERQLISDVPVGMLLSGGLDSSLIAALTAKTKKLESFSIEFEEEEFNEGKYSRLVASHLGLNHRALKISANSFFDRIDDLIKNLDEPFGDPSIIPTSILAQFAAKHVKVALGGDAGDELFGGYPTYRAHLWNANMGAKYWIPLASPWVKLLPVRNGKYQSFEWKLKRFCLRWDPNDHLRHLRWMSSLDLPDLNKATGMEAGEIIQSLPQFREAKNVDQIAEPFRAMILDYHTYMQGSVLTKVDRASMRFGLEVRPPFLDNEVITFAHSRYQSQNRRCFDQKALLKEIARKYLPQEIVDRPKRGFAIPLAKWISDERFTAKFTDIMKDSPAWSERFLKQSFFKAAWENHLTGTVDNSKPLWNLYILDRWMRKNSIIT